MFYVDECDGFQIVSVEQILWKTNTYSGKPESGRCLCLILYSVMVRLMMGEGEVNG